MAETDLSPAPGSLSMDDAVAMLNAGPTIVEDDDTEATGAAEPAADADADPEIAPVPTGDDDAAPAEEPVSGDEETEVVEPAEGPVIEPPANWDAEAKAHFAKLPPELQEYQLALETQRNTAVSTAQREAAAVRTRADADLAQVKQLSEQLATIVPNALDTLQARWGVTTPDWLALAKEHGTEVVDAWRQQHGAEVEAVKTLQSERTKATAIARADYIRTETDRFAQLIPGVTDETKKALGSYLVESGFKPEDVAEADATALHIGWKAMQWDQHQAAQKAKIAALKIPAPRPAAPATPSVRPGGAPPRSSASRDLDSLSARLTKTGSMDDAVAFLNAKQARKTG